MAVSLRERKLSKFQSLKNHKASELTLHRKLCVGVLGAVSFKVSKFQSFKNHNASELTLNPETLKPCNPETLKP
jgi:hypothetical protein